MLALLVPAAILGRTRRYLWDFVPFALAILVYSELRGLANVVRPDPYYLPQLDAERFLFGSVPSVDLQAWLWHGAGAWYDRALSVTMRIHTLVPYLLAFALWLRRRALFLRFALSMLVLSYAAAIVFVAFPAAAPWAAGEAGLLPGVERLGATRAIVPEPSGGGAGPLSVYRWLPSNPYAAIPSLHGGYSFLVFLAVAAAALRARRRWLVALAALYPAVQAYGVIYTGNHYVVDIAIGWAFAGASLVLVTALLRRRGLAV